MNCNYITSLPFEKSRAKKGGNRALAGQKRVGHSDEHLITRLRAASLMVPCLWWMDTAATGIPLQQLEVLISKISCLVWCTWTSLGGVQD